MYHQNSYQEFADCSHRKYESSLLESILSNATLEQLTLAAAILKRHYRYDDQLSIVRAVQQDSAQIQPTRQALLVTPETTIGELLNQAAHSSSVQLLQFEDLKPCDWMVSTITPDVLLSQLSAAQRRSLPEVIFTFGPQDQSFEILFDSKRVDSADVAYWASAIALLLDQIIDNQQPDQQALAFKILDDQFLPHLREIGIGKIAPTGKSTVPESSFFHPTPSTQFTFPRIFEDQVTRTPHRIAVRGVTSTAKPTTNADLPCSAFRAADHHYTYQQLNQRANQIAWWIIQQGIPFQSAVGVHLDRSPAMLAVLIGIMKADCFYVPLVPNLPASRLAFMTDDADIRCIITESALAGSAANVIEKSSLVPPKILDIDSADFNQQTLQNDQNPLSNATSNDSAYTIYTSGSTGTPKGVDIRHHSFVNLCLATNATLGFTQDDTALAITTIAFDVSICELYPLLAVGGTIAIAQDKVGANGEAFCAAIEEVKASYLCATPTSLRILVASGWQASPDLTIITGGEPISRETCNDIAPRCKRLINGYGPTEATVYTTYGHLGVGEGLVPIGRPLANVRTYVLDAQQQLVPPNVLGELYIGGEALARGYVNRAELTAEKFIPDPFSDQPDARMYASGDVCFFKHDGQIMYLGRQDNQVKIRGYRIELGEIETRLKDHPGIDDAVVIVREDTPDEKRLVGYIIAGDDRPADHEIQDFLAETMPDYMVPAWFVDLQSFPLNASKKLDRKALPAPEEFDGVAGEDDPGPTESGERRSADAQTIDALAKTIASVWSGVLGRKIRVHDEVFRMGADSLKAVKFQLELEQTIHVRVPVGEIFQYRSPEQLAARIERRTQAGGRRQSESSKSTSGSIAIIGMAGRFPGAANLDQYWENLSSGIESIRTFTPQELESAGVSPLEYRQPNYVPRGTVLEGAYDFEPEVFGITRQDAEILSPQIRLFIQSAFESLENAGYPGETNGNRIGVFAGTGYPNYLDAGFDTPGMPESRRLQTLIGNGPDYVATRTSYALGLTGPAVAIQTACSTSLVTVAEACQALRAGRCEMAIAGGASFSWPQGKGYQHGPGLIYSADGHCRAFDHRASGTIFSQGSGAVVLKPLEQAIADGDTVHAVIEGIATNNDGNRKGGFAAPSIEGQAEVIRMAIDDAGINPEQISYVEAHGTGTQIGDPIEVAGLTDAWQSYTQKTGFCGIGSVKTNIGHTDSAAGIAGLLKVILCLKHRRLTPVANFESPNPEIDFENSPFFVQTELQDWQPESKRRVAALSAFGLGGTNAHAIIAESPQLNDHDQSPATAVQNSVKPFRVVPFSARTPASVDHWVSAFAESTYDQFDFDDIVYTLRSGRRAMARRAFVIARDHQELTNALPCPVVSPGKTTRRQPVLMFTGQGSQYVDMALENYQHEPVFRNALDRCCEALANTDVDLRSLIYPAPGSPKPDINQTFHAQLAIFAVSFAQAQLWMSWGIVPSGLLGHSIGEYVAATIAEVFSLTDAINIVYQRGRLMQQMDPGSMLAIMRPAAEVEQLIGAHPSIELAVINSHTVAVVAGPQLEVEAFYKSLTDREIKSRLLKTSHAFHSKMMEPMLDEFRIALSEIKLSPPKIPIQSNVTGTWMTDQQATSPDYFVSQVRSTVRFIDNVQSVLSDDEPTLLLEMGPGSTLTQMAATLFEDDQHIAIATLPNAKEAADKSDAVSGDARFTSKTALGKVWASGNEINWDDADPWDQAPGRVPLTGYQFDTKTYRIENETSTPAEMDLTENARFHIPVWKQLPRGFADAHQPIADSTEASSSHQSVWLNFQHPDDKTSAVPQGRRTITVVPGNEFNQQGDRFIIRADVAEDYSQLVDCIIASGSSIEGVVHAWSATDTPVHPDEGPTSERFWRALDRSSFSLIWLAKALGQQVFNRAVVVNVLTRGATDGQLADGHIEETHHSLVGTMSVIQKEFPALTTSVIDVGESLAVAMGCADFYKLLQQDRHYPLVAISNGRCWEQVYENVTLETPSSPQPVFKTGGVYVITGGLGDLALAMAGHWASTYQKIHLVLIGRTGLPNRADWESTEDPKLKQRIVAVQEIESHGATVKIVTADVSDAGQLQAALDGVIEQHSRIDGLFHTAGILRDGIIATKQPEMLREVYSPKALAARHIADWQAGQQTAGRPAAGVTVLFSSISADFGMFGQVDYSGANNVLDGLASRLNQIGLRTISVNWPAFEDVGMAARTETVSSDQTALAIELAQNALFAQEGAQALARILAQHDIQRVTVSRKMFEPRRQSAIEDGRSVVLKQLEESDHQTGQNSPVELMLEIWRDQFGNDEIGVDDDYFQLGGDSLLAVGLIGRIEQTFRKLVPISHLISSPTINQLCQKLGLVAPMETETVTDRDTTEPNSGVFSAGLAPDHFVCLKEGDSSLPPLMLVHGADGAVMFYRAFASMLMTDRAIWAIESPFLKDPDHRVGESVEAVADQYVQSLLKFQKQGPFLLAGYSFGGVAAIEMTANLRRAGHDVEQTIIFDIPNPAKVEHSTALERLRGFWSKQDSEASSIAKTFSLTKRISESVRDRAKLEIENRVSSMKDDANIDSMFWRHKKARQRHMAMEESYLPPTIDAPLKVVIATGNTGKYKYDDQMGWGDVAENLETTQIPGSHLELFESEHLHNIVDATNRFLKQ